MGGRRTVEAEPGDQPHEAEQPRDHERRAPAILDGEPRHDHGCGERAHIRPGIEDPGSQRALLLRKPFGDRLQPGWEIARLTQPEREPAAALDRLLGGQV